MENKAANTGGGRTGTGRVSRRNAAARAAALLFLLAYGILAAELWREAGRERSDIDALQRAAAAGNAAYQDGADLNARFWFNRSDNTLYDAAAWPPEPYGRGTAVNGKIFTLGEASRRGYDLEKDYRRYVLLVRAVPQTAASAADGGPASEQAGTEAGFSVKTEWVYIPARYTHER